MTWITALKSMNFKVDTFSICAGLLFILVWGGTGYYLYSSSSGLADPVTPSNLEITPTPSITITTTPQNLSPNPQVQGVRTSATDNSPSIAKAKAPTSPPHPTIFLTPTPALVTVTLTSVARKVNCSPAALPTLQDAENTYTKDYQESMLAKANAFNKITECQNRCASGGANSYTDSMNTFDNGFYTDDPTYDAAVRAKYEEETKKLLSEKSSNCQSQCKAFVDQQTELEKMVREVGKNVVNNLVLQYCQV